MDLNSIIGRSPTRPCWNPDNSLCMLKKHNKLNLTTFLQETFPLPRRASIVIHLPFLCSLFISGYSIWSESCSYKRLAGSMDLSEKCPLEDGTWLPHAGMHHFANTTGGMAAFDVPDTRGPLQLLLSLGQPSCTQYVPSAVYLFKSSRVERRGHELGSQTDLGSYSWISYLQLCGLEKNLLFPQL